MATRYETMQQLLTPARAQSWKPFVADYVVAMTRTKGNRELSGEYQVKHTTDGYLIYFGTTTSYAPMTADILYSWMQRLPLKYYADQADSLRYDLCS
jgi:hypothetical protein